MAVIVFGLLLSGTAFCGISLGASIQVRKKGGEGKKARERGGSRHYFFHLFNLLYP